MAETPKIVSCIVLLENIHSNSVIYLSSPAICCTLAQLPVSCFLYVINCDLETINTKSTIDVEYTQLKAPKNMFGLRRPQTLYFKITIDDETMQTSGRPGSDTPGSVENFTLQVPYDISNDQDTNQCHCSSFGVSGSQYLTIEMYMKPSIFRVGRGSGRIGYRNHLICSLLKDKKGGYGYDERFQCQSRTSPKF